MATAEPLVGRVEPNFQASTEPHNAKPAADARAGRELARILVAARPQTSSEAALRIAAALAARHSASVEVLAAFEPRVAVPGTCLDGTHRCEMDDRAPLADLLRRTRHEMREVLGPGTSWPVQFDVGSAASMVARAAVSRSADLIVLGMEPDEPHGWRLHDRTLPELVMQSATPVLAVTPELRALPQRVLVVIDDRVAIRAAQTALPLLRRSATLFLTRCEPDSAGHVSPRPRPRGTDRLAGLAGMFSASRGVRVQSVVLRGEPVLELLGFADRHGVELVVVAAHGRSFFERTVVPSLAIPLLFASRRSVLVVPAGSASPRTGPNTVVTAIESRRN